MSAGGPSAKMQRTVEPRIKKFNLGVGVRASNGLLIPVVPPATDVFTPCSAFFALSEDHCDGCTIKFFEGAGPFPEPKAFLGELVVARLPRGPRGAIIIRVTVEIDSFGGVRVEAEDNQTKAVSVDILNLGQRLEKVEEEMESSPTMQLRPETRTKVNELGLICASASLTLNRPESGLDEGVKTAGLTELDNQTKWLAGGMKDGDTVIDRRLDAARKELIPLSTTKAPFDWEDQKPTIGLLPGSGPGGNNTCLCDGVQIQFGCPTQDHMCWGLQYSVHKSSASEDFKPLSPSDSDSYNLYVVITPINVGSFSEKLVRVLSFKGEFLHVALGISLQSEDFHSLGSVQLFEVESVQDQKCKLTEIAARFTSKTIQAPVWDSVDKNKFCGEGYIGWKVHLTDGLTVDNINEMCKQIKETVESTDYDPSCNNCIRGVFLGLDYARLQKILDENVLRFKNHGFSRISTLAVHLRRLANIRYMPDSIRGRYLDFMKAVHADPDFTPF